MSSFVRRALVVFGLIAALVLSAAQPAMAAPVPSAPAPTISGTARVNAVLTANPGTWSAGTALTYQWRTSTAVISGATAKTFVPTQALAGKTIAVTVTGRKTGYDATPKTSRYTSAVVAGVSTAPQGGTATKDDAARSATLSWTPPASNGGSAVTSYRVSRNGSDATGSGGSPITVSAASRSYVFANLTPGDTYTLSVVAVNAIGASEPATATVTMGLGTLIAATPTISGTPQVGVSLTAMTGTWTTGTSYAYQWYATGSPIAGATSKTFAPSPSQLTKQISVKVTGTKPGYTSTSRTSARTAAVTPGVPGAPTSVTATRDDAARTATISWQAPSSTGGSALTGYKPARTGIDADGNGPWAKVVAPTILSQTFTNLASGGTYTLTVAAINSIGESVNSSMVITMATGTLTASTPTITGSLQVNSTLTAVPGTWTSGTSFTYQWYAAGVSISNATKNTYSPTIADLGKPISVKVWGTKSGYNPTSKASARTAPIAAGAPGPAESVTASANDAARSATLTWQPPASNGGSPVTGYRVSRDGTDASGNGPWSTVVSASTRSRVFTNLAGGSTYNLTVTPINAAGSGAATTRPVPVAFVPPTPTLVSTGLVYDEVEVNVGTWPTGTTLTTTWFRNGVQVDREQGSSFFSNVIDLGKATSATVTGTLPGGTIVSSPRSAALYVRSRDSFDLATGLPEPATMSPRAARVYVAYSNVDQIGLGEDSSALGVPKQIPVIEPGTVIKVGDGARLGFPIRATGTPTQPIVITSLHDDSIGGDTDNNGPSIAAPGAWRGIDLTAGTRGGRGEPDGHDWSAGLSSYCALEASYIRVLNSADGMFCNVEFVETVKLSNSTIEGGVRVEQSSGTWFSVPPATQAIVDLRGNTFVRGGVRIRLSERTDDWEPPAPRGSSATISGNAFRSQTSGTPIVLRDTSINQESAVAGNTVLGLTNPHVLLATVTVSSSLQLDAGWVYDFTTVDNPREAGYIWDTISIGGALKVPEGTIVKLGPGTTIAGPIEARGTPDRRIIFTSIDDTTAGAPAPGEPAPIPPPTLTPNWDTGLYPCWSVTGFTTSSSNYGVRPPQNCAP